MKYEYSMKRHAIGVASDYIHWLPEYIAANPDVPFVLWSRTSMFRSGRDGESIERLEAALISEAAAYSCNVLSSFRGKGEKAYIDADRIQFDRACRYAKKHDAALLALTRYRFLRYRLYHEGKGVGDINTKVEKFEAPTEAEYEIAFGRYDIDFVTVEDPDVKGHSRHIKVGIKQSMKFDDGEGYRARRASEMKPLVFELSERGWSLRKIQDEVNSRFSKKYPPITYETVRFWMG